MPQDAGLRYNRETRRYEPAGETSAPNGRAGGSGRSLRGVLGLPEKTKSPEEMSDLERTVLGLPPKAKEDDSWRDWVATGIRGLSGLVPGGPWGAAAGGAGEALAQLIDTKEGFNTAQVATQAGLGFIPFGRSLKGVGQAVVRGGAHGALGGGATHLAETGIPTSKDDLEGLAASTVLGGVIGGAAGGGAAKLGKLLRGRGETGVPSDRYSAGIRGVPGERGTFDARVPDRGVGVKPGEGTVRPRIPVRANTADVVPPEGVPQSTYVTDDFRPTRVIDEGPSPYELSQPRTLADVLDPAPTTIEDASGIVADAGSRPRPRLSADETAAMLAGRQKFADKVGLDYGTGGMAPGFYDDLDRMGVEYTRTQRELKRLLGMPDADPREVERMRQGARELGSRLRKGAQLPPISGGDHVQAAAPSPALSPVSTARVPDEILPPEPTLPARSVDPLQMIESVNELPHAQVWPQASDVGSLANLLGVNLDKIPTSKRGPRTGIAVDELTVPQPQAAPPQPPAFSTKIASDVASGRAAQMPKVSDEQASAIRRLFSERGGAATVRPETSDDLMRRGLPPEFSGMLGNETGEAAADIQFGLLSGVLGGGAGYVFSPDDHKALGTAAGVAAGLGGYGAMRRPDLWEQWTTAAMLSSPKTFAKIIGGNIGGPLIRAGQRAFVDQDPEIVSRTAREIFSPDTASAFSRKFQESADSVDADRLGPGYATSGPASWPGRIIGSLDYASKDAMSRAGFSPEDAARVTMTSEPQNPLLAKMLNAQREHRSARIPFPFFKTAANAFEQGLLEPAQSAGRVLRGEGSRQDTATLATLLGVGGAGYAAGELLPWWAEPFATAAAGPYMAPAAIGAVMSHADDSATPTDKLIQMMRAAAQQLPLAEASDYDPRQILARAVPNVARDVAVLMDDEERQTNQGLFDAAIAKIPFLREYLQPKKRKTRED